MNEYVVLGIIVLVIVLFFSKQKIRNHFFSSKEIKNMTIDDQFNAKKREREKEIDRLLDKMGKNGINDLSEKDRKRLDELSKK